MGTSNHRRLIPEYIQKRFIDLMAPFINLFARWAWSPNAFTVSGVIITTVAAMAFLLDHVRLGGALVLLGGLCDTIDGNLARSTSKTTRFGALFDSTIDRYSEFIMFFGLTAYFVLTGEYGTAVASFFALTGSMMVSYTRARAESLGFDAKVGIMQRPERIVFLGLGALIHPIALKIAIWLIAACANYTAMQRIRHAYKQDARGAEEKSLANPDYTRQPKQSPP